MKILLTGGAGFIGNTLVRRLLAEPDHVVCTLDVLTYAGDPRNLADFAGHPRHRFEAADIRDSAALDRVFRDFAPDWVLHLAAESHVDRSIAGPAAFVQTNIVGTFHLLEAARAHFDRLAPADRLRFRFVHVSTDEVYGSLGPEGLFTEDTRYDPRSPYSASKAAADHLARAWCATYGLPVIVTHASNNYGPRQFPEKLVPVVILNALRGLPIPLYGRGDNTRDWLHVEDHAEALAQLAARGRPGQSYHIGGDNQRTNLDLARLLCRHLDEFAPRPDRRPHADAITFVADRPGHDFRYALDAGKLRAELGWRPRHDPESGFRSTVRWYLDNPDWWRPLLDRARPAPAP